MFIIIFSRYLIPYLLASLIEFTARIDNRPGYW